MDFPLFLAMTGAEFAVCRVYPPKIAYMSCHFSSSGPGVSGIPKWLPPGSALMLTDEIPPSNHDPWLVAAELADTVEKLRCKAILLDLQRPELPENRAIAEAVATLPCSTAVSAIYAKDLSCGVLLPPPPLWTTLPQHLAPWQGRPIWLEMAQEGADVTLTENGSTYTPCACTSLSNSFHHEPLHIDYDMQFQESGVLFHLRRNRKRMGELLAEAKELGIENALALYQQENAPL